jgi:proline dehydrogenase
MVKALPLVPKWVVRRVAKRYVAGETLADAMAAVTRLNADGCAATVDLLGEFITREAEADVTRDGYLEMLAAIAAQKLNCNVSVKLTAFGLLLDRERCFLRVRDVVAAAKSYGNFVRIDMEDSPCTDRTIGIFRQLREEGFENVGLVLQACLKRTAEDIRALAPLLPSFRLCKGIYIEPETIAYRGLEPVRSNYRQLLAAMFATSVKRVAIATHDHVLVEYAQQLIREQRIPRERYEFQMLLGVTEQLRQKLIREGEAVRVYVPFGKDWHGYCTRRLKENPAIAGHVLKAMLGFGG